ncbi:kinase [Pseudoalteromonas luteoviolacea]|uniref:kinase n=1 Tax=Pseudoalteromonas luteoviolacea TaxID=43657 RepID=UPI001B374712|nr:kinase [Pseudoalteromonas luteoviolacea]MBQ4836876.1 kinase [Pseudoalteromonas luteoviolacea]
MSALASWQRLFCETHKVPIQYIKQTEKALDWLESAVNGQVEPQCIAISGCQGSGKSTLAAYYVAYLRAHGYLAESVSIDDFYYSKSERQNLAKRLSAPFATRGAPGTHDVQAAISVVTQFKQREPFILPQFDKSTDNPYPVDTWKRVPPKLDVLIIEGWCLGLPMQPTDLVQSTCNVFEQQNDPSGQYREQVNNFLAADYQVLFEHFDKLVFLNGQKFERVFQWRLEQEKKLIAAKGVGMTNAQVFEFIQSYQRLTEWGFATLPAICDLELKLDEGRGIS